MMTVRLESLPKMSADTAKRNPQIHAVKSTDEESRDVKTVVRSKGETAGTKSTTGRDAESPLSPRKSVNLHEYRGRSNARRTTNAVFENAPIPLPQSDDMRNLTLALMGVVGIVLYARGLPQAIWGAARNGAPAAPYPESSAGVSFADSGGTGTGTVSGTSGVSAGASPFVPSNPSLSPAQVAPVGGNGDTNMPPADPSSVPGYLRNIFSGIVSIPTGKIPAPKTRITSICVTDPTMCADPVPTPYG